MLLQCGLKLSTRCPGSGASQEVQAKIATISALPEATWYELQSDLKMAATCVGLGGAQVRPSC